MSRASEYFSLRPFPNFHYSYGSMSVWKNWHNVRLTSGLPMVSPVLSRGKIHVPMRNKKAARRLSATAHTARRPGARAPHNYTKARLQLTRLRHIDVSFCQHRSWPQNTPRGVLRVADPANSHHNYFLSNPRIASPLLIISAYYLAFAKKNDEWCQAF